MANDLQRNARASALLFSGEGLPRGSSARVALGGVTSSLLGERSARAKVFSFDAVSVCKAQRRSVFQAVSLPGVHHLDWPLNGVLSYSARRALSLQMALKRRLSEPFRFHSRGQGNCQVLTAFRVTSRLRKTTLRAVFRQTARGHYRKLNLVENTFRVTEQGVAVSASEELLAPAVLHRLCLTLTNPA